MDKTKIISGVSAAIAAFFLACLMMMSAPTNALAADSNDDAVTIVDTAGNLLNVETSKNYQDEVIENTLFWAGQGLTVSDSEIALDAFGAGQSMSLSNTRVGSNLFLAGQTVSLTNVAVNGNIFYAGQILNMDESSFARGLYVAAQEIDFKGYANYLALAGDQVTLSGTVAGDALILADHVTISPDAVIEGTLEIRSDERPEIPSSAAIGNLKYTHVENDASEESSENAGSAIAAGLIISLIGSLIGAAIAGLLIYWLNRRTLTTAASYLKTRPSALLVSGLVTIIALPLVAIIGFIAFSWQVSVSLILCAAMITLLAAAFTGASLMQMIIPKLNPIAAAALGAAAFMLLTKIPFIGFLFGFFAVMFTTGYVIQWIYLNSLGKPNPKQADATPEQQDATPLQSESASSQIDAGAQNSERNQPPVPPTA